MSDFHVVLDNLIVIFLLFCWVKYFVEQYVAHEEVPSH